MILTSPPGKLRKIVFVGEQLSGKSTVINSLLGRKIIPESIFTCECKFEILPSNENALILPEGTREDLSQIDELSETNSSLVVHADSQYLSENGLEFAEFPASSVLNQDISHLIECYKSDAVVLILTADKFMSQSEQNFIANYIKYINSRKLFIVINKLSLFDESEHEKIKNYAAQKIAGICPGVKYIFADSDSWQDKARREIINTANDNTPRNLESMKIFIASQLDKDLDSLRKEAEKNRIASINNNPESRDFIIQSDNARTEFGRREIKTVELINGYIKSEIQKIIKSPANTNITGQIKNIAQNAAEKVVQRLNNDISCLSAVLERNLDLGKISPVDIDIINVDNKADFNNNSLGKYANTALYGGSAGGVIISALLAKYFGIMTGIIPGLIIMSAGAFGHHVMKSDAQIKADQAHTDLNLAISECEDKIIQAVDNEIKRIYGHVLTVFNKNADSELARKVIDYSANSQDYEKISALENLSRHLKGA